MMVCMNKPAFDFVIIPTSWQRSFLANRGDNDGSPHRFLTKENIIEYAFFRPKPDAPYVIAETEAITIKEASRRLAALPFLDATSLSNRRLDALTRIRQTLERNGLLEHLGLEEMLRGKRGLVLGYAHNDPELLNAVRKLNIRIDFYEPAGVGKPTIISFASVKEEVHHFFNEAAQLIENGVPISDIKLFLLDSKYSFDLKLASRYFGIPINLPQDEVWGKTPIGIHIKRRLAAGETIDDIFSEMAMQKAFGVPEAITHLWREINHRPINETTKRRLFRERLDGLPIQDGAIVSAIECVTVPFANPAWHVFVLGANNDLLPHIHLDDDFLPDDIKMTIGMLTSVLENEHERSTWFSYIATQPNLRLYWQRQERGEELYPSPLFASLNEDSQAFQGDIVDYSGSLGRLTLAHMLDQKRVYKIDHPFCQSYRRQHENTYRSFDYRYRKFPVGLEHSKMRLAYTGIKTFYQCQFRYYLDVVLKLDENEEDNFFIKFGNLAHDLLERRYQPDFDFEATFSDLAANTTFTVKERTLLQRLKQDLAAVIEFNRDHEASMSLDRIDCEVKSKFDLDELTTLFGKIDKVIITKDANGVYAAIVDYKTGSDDFDPRKIPHGFSLQLPIYALLVSRDERYRDIDIIGYYIQNIIASKLIRPSSKAPDSFYHDQLKLRGMSIDDSAKLATLDANIASSPYIRSIRLTKINTFDKRAKVADAATLESHRLMAEQKITAAVRLIRDGDFAINPKRIDNVDMSCTYCPFRDVCFRTEAAFTNIETRQGDATDEPDLE